MTMKKIFDEEETFENLTTADDEEKTFAGDYRFYLSAGKQLIFIYVNIIEYQYAGDTKTPLIWVIDSKQRLKNGSPCEIEPTHRVVFSNLEYKVVIKKLSVHWISIADRNRTISSNRWNRKSYFDLNLKSFD